MNNFDPRLEKLAIENPPYTYNAFMLIIDALNDTQSRNGTTRHLSGQELSNGIKNFAIARYGIFAKGVLNSFGLFKTADFGQIVYILIDAGIFSKTEEDKKSDFDDVFDFHEAFTLPILSSDSRAIELLYADLSGN